MATALPGAGPGLYERSDHHPWGATRTSQDTAINVPLCFWKSELHTIELYLYVYYLHCIMFLSLFHEVRKLYYKRTSTHTHTHTHTHTRTHTHTHACTHTLTLILTNHAVLSINLSLYSSIFLHAVNLSWLLSRETSVVSTRPSASVPFLRSVTPATCSESPWRASRKHCSVRRHCCTLM